MDSDDDLPPPLDDMTEKLQENKKFQSAVNSQQKKVEEPVEETRLGGGVKETSKIGASEALPEKTQAQIQYEKMQLIQAQTPTPQQKPAPVKQPEPKTDKKMYSGMQGGFFNSAPKKKPAQAVKAVAKAPVIEDHTNLKATKKEDIFKMPEVQDALNSNLMKDKDKWCNEDLMSKIAANPKLLAALQDPEMNKAIQEMGKDPKGAMEKYGHNPQFREILQEFSQAMASNFENLAEKEAEKKKEEMKNDPIMKIIETDPQVKEILADPKVTQLIHKLQQQGGLDFQSVAAKDPELGKKLMILIQKGVFNTQSSMPAPV